MSGKFIRKNLKLEKKISENKLIRWEGSFPAEIFPYTTDTVTKKFSFKFSS